MQTGTTQIDSEPRNPMRPMHLTPLPLSASLAGKNPSHSIGEGIVTTTVGLNGTVHSSEYGGQVLRSVLTDQSFASEKSCLVLPLLLHAAVGQLTTAVHALCMTVLLPRI